MPASVPIAAIEWTLDRPAQVNRSQWTGKEQVVADPWHARWSAELTLRTLIGQASILAWRSFLVQLKGHVNTFRLVAVEAAQNAYSPTVQTTAGASGTTLPLTGFPAVVATVMTAGQMFTVNDQLCVLTADLVTNGAGQGTATFQPPLRASAAATTAVQVQRPTCLVALRDSTAGWSVDRGQLYGVKLTVDERF
jgi:hypothetical protein